MTLISKKTILASLAAAALAIGVAAIPTEAEARRFGGGFGRGGHIGGMGMRGFHGGRYAGFRHGHHRHHRWGRGFGWGALAVTTAVAADCYLVRRRFVDDFGNVYVRPVSVCD